MKRVFLIVLDSFGVGEMKDSAEYGDAGSNTLRAVASNKYFNTPNMAKLGLFHLDGLDDMKKENNLLGSYARMAEASKGKDTTIGHWEIAGIISESPLPTFPDGFPQELLDELSKRTGRGILCNKPYSGTEVIKDFGEEHVKTGDLIVYTSADSVLQIAAHEAVVPIEELYRYCDIAREICQGPWGVGRIIARPFEGEAPNFKRTSRRHDYSLVPPKATMLDAIKESQKEVLAVGKIFDIFAGAGITDSVRTANNAEGIERTIDYMKKDFEGLCFTNLVDFDMVYGHRNDVEGYAKALTYFDEQMPRIVELLKEDDILILTADHGCDPSTESTDHSREHTPCLIYGNKIKEGVNLGTRDTFADIAATILEYLDVKGDVAGKSFLGDILR
ncbi:phosphopentomutase [Anaerocolumna aminovalerica]|jgi:phosphopentomutase|uniref:Phosphopentomutase n=1 Tax=Anaerocolumna aminovalerica TaxID=1527 RepID=A0A1I5HD24_9FIRM|nr:phosphopentomutase [Anaerocolumna aminovalerica]MBU5333751.1 phosphopentomutase [Anaerocolumna aminovalerica]MDU6265282.1 phosphopentomutase [Anaerocolumna aminovalerica]SFO46238.1 phosphopentomutase [Anaerocolumna aminovalerica]